MERDSTARWLCNSNLFLGRSFFKSLEFISGFENKVSLLAVVFYMNEIDLVFQLVKENPVTHLRAFETFGHFRFDVEPDGVGLCFHADPGESFFFAFAVLERERALQVSERERGGVRSFIETHRFTVALREHAFKVMGEYLNGNLDGVRLGVVVQLHQARVKGVRRNARWRCGAQEHERERDDESGTQLSCRWNQLVHLY